MTYIISWFIVFVVLLLIELFTADLVTIWFSIGSLAAMIAAFFTGAFIIQVIVFLIVSIISFICTKKLIKKYIRIKSSLLEVEKEEKQKKKKDKKKK